MRNSLTFTLALLLTSGFAQSQTQTVDFRLTISDGAGGRQVLQLGLAPSATNGFDVGLCETVRPPVPPAGGFDARFIGTDIGVSELSDGTLRDYRTGDKNFVGTQTHELQYQPGAGTIISISWDLPTGVTGLLQDLLGGVVVNQPMNGIGAFTVSNPGIISKLKMIITYTGTITLAPPSPPALVTPLNGAINVTDTPFAWNASPGAAAYQLQVSTDPSFATTVVDQSDICDTSRSVSGLSSLTVYYWRVRASNAGVNGGWATVWSFTTGMTVGVKEAPSPRPEFYSLEQNYPNPFNPSSAIVFQIPITGHVTLKIYDILGNEVATLVNEQKSPGAYRVNFDASGLADGTYFYRLQAGQFTQTKKLMLLR
jgi:Secretion system C-terminal sorting domain